MDPSGSILLFEQSCNYMEFLYDRKWLRGRRQKERFCARNEHLSPFFYQSVVQWGVCGKQER